MRLPRPLRKRIASEVGGFEIVGLAGVILAAAREQVALVCAVGRSWDGDEPVAFNVVASAFSVAVEDRIEIITPMVKVPEWRGSWTALVTVQGALSTSCFQYCLDQKPGMLDQDLEWPTEQQSRRQLEQQLDTLTWGADKGRWREASTPLWVGLTV
jgi:hypothetical protein